MKKIYYNGDFITLENTEIQAILVEDGIIKKIGSLEKVFSYKDKNTRLIDLHERTMMPSFIDSHSHFSGVANNFLKVNLENCKNFKEIQDKLKDFKIKKNIDDNAWILADGYDHNYLEEKSHPKKQVIDNVLPHNPVVLQHKSGHVGIFNSLALKILNITSSTPSIDGGIIEKVDGQPTGYMEENTFLYFLNKIPLPDINTLLNLYQKAQDHYLSYGITTIQDGMAYDSFIPIYQKLLDNQKLKLDLVAYISPQDSYKFFSNFKDHIRQYKNNFKIGGYKIFLDGSPQGKTAWMRAPYIDDPNYFGYNTMTNLEVENTIQMGITNNMQVLAHCNGDKAAEQFINSIKKYEDTIKHIRPVMIHAQFLGIDQIDDLKKYNIIPSFFISHTFHWGDIHIKNFGYERACKISPANSTLKKNIIFTFHQDSPVLQPNMFETIWCAVTRITKSGIMLGKDEKISVLDAIKALTLNSAYQYFEENEKGSIKEGKKADLIIIDKNPLKIDTDEIKNIKILETIKQGVTLFR